MKNAQLTDAINGAVKQLGLVLDGAFKAVTPEKTAYEKKKEYDSRTTQDWMERAKADPEGTIAELAKHRSK